MNSLLKILLIAALILLIFFLMSSKDFFDPTSTPNPYKIAWQSPTNNGGDPKCCSYDWQICEDSVCSTIVDSGTTSNLFAETTKLKWDTTYNVWIRASNISGKGEWAKVELSTGDGVVSSISIGAKINQDGTIQIPLSANAGSDVEIWTSLAKGSVDPNTLVGTATVTAMRSGSQLFVHTIPLSSSTSGETSVFQGSFSSAGIPLILFQKGDIVYADVYIADSKGNVVTESVSNQIPVTKSVPGGVSGISLIYTATPPPIAFVNKYQQWINNLYTQNPSPYATVQDSAAAALQQFNSMPAPATPSEYQTKMSLFFLSQMSWIGTDSSNIFRGIGYLYVKLNSMGWDNQSICAAFNLYRKVPADPKFASSFNNGSGLGTNSPGNPIYSWGPGGINVQSYYNQIQAVLATNSTTFSPNLSTAPSQVCPTITDCQSCKPVVSAPVNTNVCSDGNMVVCNITGDQIPYWKGMGSSCTCNC